MCIWSEHIWETYDRRIFGRHLTGGYLGDIWPEFSCLSKNWTTYERVSEYPCCYASGMSGWNLAVSVLVLTFLIARGISRPQSWGLSTSTLTEQETDVAVPMTTYQINTDTSVNVIEECVSFTLSKRSTWLYLWLAMSVFDILCLALCMSIEPIAVAARSKAWVFGRSLVGIVGSNPT
jgi:hypothetical protein